MWIPGDLNCLLAPNICSVGVVVGDRGTVSKGREGCSDLIWSSELPVLQGRSFCCPSCRVWCSQPPALQGFQLNNLMGKLVIFCQSCTTASEIKGLNARALERASLETSGGKWSEGGAEGRAGKQMPWRVSRQVSQAASLHVWNLYCPQPIIYMVFIFHFLLKEVERYLRHNDFLNLRKKELLYKKYHEDVSEPFMQKMKDRMDSKSQREVQKRKQEQLSQYLNYCTKKVSTRSTFLSWWGLYAEGWDKVRGLAVIPVSWVTWSSDVPCL